jgi:hypothetical protein
VHLTKELRDKLDELSLTIEGKDVEYWAGHFGPQFSGERLYIENSQENEAENPKDLLSIFKA